MISLAPQLDEALRKAGIPIIGVSIGNPTDRATWRVQFVQAATVQQRAAAAALIAAFDDKAERVPDTVTRFQLKAALLAIGRLTDVDLAMQAPDVHPLARLAWTEAPTFTRTSPAFRAVANLLTLTDTQIDQLMLAAAAIAAA